MKGTSKSPFPEKNAKTKPDVNDGCGILSTGVKYN
jgi:hypothetical protein